VWYETDISTPRWQDDGLGRLEHDGAARTPCSGDDRGRAPMGTTDDRVTETIYQQVQKTDEFVDLRHRLRRFVFPMSVGFLLWYLAYVLLASYAPDFMAIKLVGNINVGLLIGLLQFVSTFVITAIYVRYANNHLDPAAARIREKVEEAA
jgi:uncharacterized membrane protein (DUF485 family)